MPFRTGHQKALVLFMAVAMSLSSLAGVIQPGGRAGSAVAQADAVPLIAYTAEDGNIRLVGIDGTGATQITDDGSSEYPYRDPNWSPDGSMLVFSRPAINDDERNGIYLWRDGTIERIPTISNCSSADFTTDGTRLALLCGLNRVPGAAELTQETLDADPSRGMVSVVDLDGEHWEVVAPFPLELDGEPTLWWQMLGTYDISVSAHDGEILVNSTLWSSARSQQLHLFTANGDRDGLIGPPDGLGQVTGRFPGDGENILSMICPGCYRDSTEQPNVSIVWLNRSGEIIDTVLALDPAEIVYGYDLSPDGSTLVVATTMGQTDAILPTGDIRVIDRASGAETTVGRGADLAWQTTGESTAAGAAGGSGAADPTAEPAVAPTEPPATFEAMAFGERRIAYVGNDGNIWTMRDDGTDPVQVTTNGTVQYGLPTFSGPSWSHDGSMLTFAGGVDLQQGKGVWLYRDGVLSLLPGTDMCGGAEFSADNQRLLYSCIGDGMWDDVAPTDFATNPLRSVVSSSALDGSDQRVEIAYTTDGSGIDWVPGTGFTSGAIADVDPVSGEMLVVITGYRWAGFAVFSSNGVLQGEVAEISDGNETYGPYNIRFLPGSGDVILTWCQAGCGRTSSGPGADAVVVMDRTGAIVTQWTPVVSGQQLAGFDVSPTGEFAVFARGAGYEGPFDLVVARAGEEGTTIGQGSSPAWQPEAIDAAAAAPESIAVPTVAAQPTGPVPASGTLLFSAFDGTQWDIWEYDFQSLASTQITNTPANETSPALSPGGTRIAYLSDASGSPQVWSMAPNGSEQRQLAIWAGDPVTEVMWTPSGDAFLLVVEEPDGPRVMIMPASGGLITELVPSPASDPSVDGDGAIWYSTTEDGMSVVARYDASGSDLQATPGAVTPGAAPGSVEAMAGRNPAVSADGSLLVFETGEAGSRRIAGAWLNGLGSLMLPQGPGDHHDPVLSADNGFVIWLVDDGSSTTAWVAATSGQGNLYAVVDLGEHAAVADIAWAP